MSPETAASIDQIQVTLNAGGMNTINIVLAFVMFGVSLGIKPGTFIEVFSKPKSVLLGALCQLVLLPAFTCLLAIALSWCGRQYLQLHVVPREGQCGAVREPDRHLHGPRRPDDPVQLLALGQRLPAFRPGRARGSDPGHPALGRVQDHLHPPGHSARGGHPDRPLPAQGRASPEEAPAVDVHPLLPRDGRPFLRRQHGRLHEVRQVYLPGGPDPQPPRPGHRLRASSRFPRRTARP